MISFLTQAPTASLYLCAIGGYLLFLLAISAYKSRHINTQDDFMVAGRQVSALFLAGTLVCTWIGAGSLFGGAGRAFREGFSALWMSAGAWVGIAFCYFLAHRVRKLTQYTVPDIIEMRYTPTARLLATIAIVLAYVTIAGYQFVGAGRLLNLLTGIEPIYGQLLTCSLVILYTVLAGMMSIVALDILNGLLITVGVLIAAPFALRSAGGWSSVIETLPDTHFSVFGSLGLLPALGLFLPTLFLLLGESSMYQKFMSARDGASAKRAVIGMILGVIVIEIALDATAIFGAAIYWNNPDFVSSDGTFQTQATETILLQVARYNLPPLVGVFLAVGAAAIVFSTATTFLLIPSTNIIRDIYQRFICPEANESNLIRAQRGVIVGLALLAVATSSMFESVLDMALYAYTMVGAAVTPALLGAFLWKRATAAGGTASVALGISITIIYATLNTLGVTNLDYDFIIYPAGGASIAALIIVSLLTPPPPKSKWKPFWGKSHAMDD